MSDELKIEERENGPLVVTGATSKNKPFCDGSHRDAKWRDTDAGWQV